jgi:hypothetical protein
VQRVRAGATGHQRDRLTLLLAQIQVRRHEYAERISWRP